LHQHAQHQKTKGGGAHARGGCVTGLKSLLGLSQGRGGRRDRVCGSGPPSRSKHAPKFSRTPPGCRPRLDPSWMHVPVSWEPPLPPNGPGAHITNYVRYYMIDYDIHIVVVYRDFFSFVCTAPPRARSLETRLTVWGGGPTSRCKKPRPGVWSANQDIAGILSQLRKLRQRGLN
jgi:hypothetical protein